MTLHRRGGWRLWLGLAVSVVCLILVARRVDWVPFWASIRHARGQWLVASCAASAIGYGFAGYRWRLVVKPHVRLALRESFEFVMIGNFANLVAPSRMGDVVRAVIVARRGGVPASRVLGSMVIERYADVVMLLSLALLLSRVVTFSPAIQFGVTAFVVIAVLGVLVMGALWPHLPGWVYRAVRVVAPRAARRSARLTYEVVRGIRTLPSGRSLAAIMGASLGIWVMSGLAMMCNLAAFQLPMPWYGALFVMLVINLGGVIPASPGAVGLYHYLAVLALSQWVSDSSIALGFAVVSHATALGVVAVLGAVSMVSQRLTLGTIEAEAQAVVASQDQLAVHRDHS